MRLRVCIRCRKTELLHFHYTPMCDECTRAWYVENTPSVYEGVDQYEIGDVEYYLLRENTDPAIPEWWFDWEYNVDYV